MSGAENPGGESVVITVCPNGPLLVRGPASIVDKDGSELPRHRPTIALCRCGKSRLAPLCDGTHKLLRDRAG
jgi:CDGSH-type Zn-finger protein